MWWMENVWRFDDSAHHLSHLEWQESRLRKTQNLSMLLLELPSWIWKVWEACAEWSEQGCWLGESKHQSGRELMVSYHLLEGLWHNEAPSVCSRVALWTAQLSPHWLGRTYHQLTILFQVPLAGLGLRCEKSTYISSQGRLLFSWTGEGSNIFLCFSDRDTHNIARKCFSLAFRFLRNSCPLLAFDNVRWTHIISPRGVRIGTRPFSFLLWGSVLITLSSTFGMKITPAGTDGSFLPNWRDVILVVTFFYSGRSLRTFVSIRA